MIDPIYALQSLIEVYKTHPVTPEDLEVLKAAEKVLRALSEAYNHKAQSESELLAQIYG